MGSQHTPGRPGHCRVNAEIGRVQANSSKYGLNRDDGSAQVPAQEAPASSLTPVLQIVRANDRDAIHLSR